MFCSAKADVYLSDLVIVTEALDGYCFLHDIKDEIVREDIARPVLVHEGGAKTVAELTGELDRLRVSDMPLIRSA
jgi:hypothetical protein